MISVLRVDELGGPERRRRPHGRRAARAIAGLAFLGLGSVAGARDEPEQKTDAPPSDSLYETGKALFDQYAPPEIKEEFEFPTPQQWDEFAARLQHALDNDNLAELAGYLPQARAALVALRAIPGYDDYADWLEERIDTIEAARDAAATPELPPAVRPPIKPGETPSPRTDVPYLDLWLRRVRNRPMPARAEKYLPVVQTAFRAEGVPEELAWMAEAESTFNPAARSPAGAKGLFQMMPDTAKKLGLSTFLPDERVDAEKSAHAAARYLRDLHEKFGSWPLALAAYNAGEGRVQRLLQQRGADSFGAIAGALPSETRMYVPKVCATIAVRTGVAVSDLGRPRAS